MRKHHDFLVRMGIRKPRGEDSSPEVQEWKSKQRERRKMVWRGFRSLVDLAAGTLAGVPLGKIREWLKNGKDGRAELANWVNTELAPKLGAKLGEYNAKADTAQQKANTTVEELFGIIEQALHFDLIPEPLKSDYSSRVATLRSRWQGWNEDFDTFQARLTVGELVEEFMDFLKWLGLEVD